MAILNGCDTRSYDKKSKKCRLCMNSDYCAFKKSQPRSYEMVRWKREADIAKGDILTDSMMSFGISALDASEAMSRLSASMIFIQESNGEEGVSHD